MNQSTDLSVIDSILLNLASVQNLYEFEYDQLARYVGLLQQYEQAKLDTPELKKDSKIFKKEYNKEIKFYHDRMNDLKAKAQKVSDEIKRRKDAKDKLMILFNSLKSLDSLDQGNDSKDSGDDGGLPIMSIKEELDDNDNVVRSEVKPYEQAKQQLFGKAYKNMKTKPQKEEKIKEIDEDKKEKPKKETAKKEMVKKSKKKATRPSKMDMEVKSMMKSSNSVKEVVNLREKVKKNVPKKKQVKKVNAKQAESKTTSSADDMLHPYTIKEEIDEDGNIIKSSVRKLPNMGKKESQTEIKSKDQISDDQLKELFHDMDLKPPSKKSNAPKPKIEELPDEDEKLKKEVKPKDEQKSKADKKPTTDDKSKNEDKSVSNKMKKVQHNIKSSMYRPEIDPDDLLTLEVIADEVDKKGDEDKKNDEAKKNDEDDEKKECEINDSTGIGSMVPPESRELLFEKIKQLRISRKTKADEADGKKDKSISKEEKSLKSSIKGKSKNAKPKKKVKFAQSADIKEVEDVWDDLREAEKQGGHPKVSRFKLMMEGEEALDEEEAKEKKAKKAGKHPRTVVNGLWIGDVKEHKQKPIKDDVEVNQNEESGKSLFDESVEQQTSDVVLKKDRLKPEDSMTKLKGKKKASKFHWEHVAKMGLKYQKNKDAILNPEPPTIAVSQQTKPSTMPKLNSSGLGKKSLKSLQPVRHAKIYSSARPRSTKETSNVISAPTDPNPANNSVGLGEEDFDFVRENISEDNANDDEARQISEEYDIVDRDEVKSTEDDANFVQKHLPDVLEDKKPVKLTAKQAAEISKSITNAKLDYRAIGHNDDAMAKAYVMGLYDDDVEENGQVISELKDFEKHNKEVKKMEAELAKSDEKDQQDQQNDEDSAPILKEKVVERTVDESSENGNDDTDMELTQENLNTQVALDYARMREKMVHKYNGGFNKTAKEKEFEPLDDTPQMSRFKAARLDMH